jgi:hypothetical protein
MTGMIGIAMIGGCPHFAALAISMGIATTIGLFDSAPEAAAMPDPPLETRDAISRFAEMDETGKPQANDE